MLSAVLQVLLLAPGLTVAQEVPLAPSQFDRSVSLELVAGDPHLIDGFGPTRVVEYEAGFEGTLHVWTSSELEVAMLVEDPDGGELPGDEDSADASITPYVCLDVAPGDELAILVAAARGSAGPVTLHLIAAAESDDTLDAADGIWDAHDQALELLDEGDPDSVRELIAEALELAETRGAEHSQEIVEALWEIATVASDTGLLHEALTASERVRRHCERTLPPDHLDLLSARANLALAMAEVGDLAGARALEESVVAGYERTLPPDDPDLLAARANLAVSLGEMGDLAGARALEEAVVAGYERTLAPDDPELLSARSNLAVSVAEMGDVAGARALEEAILAALERSLPRDHPEVLAARSNLAVSMAEMGDVAGARALEESVLAALELTLPADHPEVLAARANLAVSMDEMGEVAEARALRESVLETLASSLPADHFDVLSARVNLALSLDATGDPDGALELREAVVESYERTLPPDHTDLLYARASLARSKRETGDLGGARALRESVLESYERTLPPDHPDLLAARAELALSRARTGDLPGARMLIPALCAGMRARILASLALAPREARRAVGAEGWRLAAALSLSQSGGAELTADVFELTETMRSVAGEAARSLARFDADPELAPLLGQADAVRRALNDLIAGVGRDDEDADAVSAELTRLSLERDRLERRASRLLAERGVVTHAFTAGDLVRVLGPNDAAVGYRRIPLWHVTEESERSALGPDHLLAHVLRGDGTLTRVDLGPADELEELASAWRASLGAPLLRGVATTSDGDPEVGAGVRLRERILDPLISAAGADAERLFVCGDDFVFLLPLDALPLNDDGSARVGDRLRIVSEVSFARLLAQEPPLDEEPSLLALGGADYDAPGAPPDRLVASTAAETPTTRGSRSPMPKSFQKLLQARYEAEATADLFEEAFEREPTLLERKEATKAALFEAAAGKRYLHLATHGWFAPESVRSSHDPRSASPSFSRMAVEERVRGLAPMTLCGLAMAGANIGRDSLGRMVGILTAEELCSLDLSRCELAVLSACETNVGIRRAGQGIQSLQAALYAAGARTSITSLWKVDDAATRRLMELFYTNLWIEDLGKAEALWEAKKALREEDHPPAHWAGWVLTGDPD